MRILDEKSDKKLDTISLFLTKQEALQLVGYINSLINSKSDDHAHFSSEDYQKEITLYIYDAEAVNHLHPRAKKLIIEDQ